MHPRLLLLWLQMTCVIIITCLAACDQSASPPAAPGAWAPATTAQRPARWAQPIDRPGLPNLHCVDDRLYRGAQPTDEGFAQLKAMGVKTVVNLRSFHSDRSECEEAGLAYVPISVQAWEGEMTSPSHLVPRGWTAASVEVGEKITITGYPAKNGSHAMRVAKIVLSNGKELKLGGDN